MRTLALLHLALTGGVIMMEMLVLDKSQQNCMEADVGDLIMVFVMAQAALVIK